MLSGFKKKLQRFVSGRDYTDQRFNELEKLLKEQQKKQLAAIADVKKYVDQEWKRHDDWVKRAAETRRLAAGRQVWVIKCPAPDAPRKVKWGDYHYAVALKKYLERLDLYVLLDTREDWDCESDADVVLVLRGNGFYRPDRRNEHCLYIMWNISHPDMVTEEEYRLYDVVCIASGFYAEEMRKKLDVPVISLLQCTDTEVFCPEEKWSDHSGSGYVFIGNSRGIARNCVMWAADSKIPLRIWGTGWEKILGEDAKLVEAPSIENSEIPELYRNAKATLNDHWQDMLEKQFMNNRIFDALACGTPVISDTFEELAELFPDAVLHYSSRKEFDDCIRRMENEYDSIRESVRKQWPVIQEKYSFEARARELKEIADKYR